MTSGIGWEARPRSRQGAGLCGEAIVRYKVETLRLIANMSLGVGALAVIGGTVVIVTTLTMSVGGLVAIQLFRSLSDVGVQALSGFASAYINTRLAAPLVACIGLAATIGAGATASWVPCGSTRRSTRSR